MKPYSNIPWGFLWGFLWGSPQGKNLSHSHSHPMGMGIPMGIPIPTATLEICGGGNKFDDLHGIIGSSEEIGVIFFEEVLECEVGMGGLSCKSVDV